jgi:hypothetical protein
MLSALWLNSPGIPDSRICTPPQAQTSGLLPPAQPSLGPGEGLPGRNSIATGEEARVDLGTLWSAHQAFKYRLTPGFTESQQDSSDPQAFGTDVCLTERPVGYTEVEILHGYPSYQEGCAVVLAPVH